MAEKQKYYNAPVSLYKWFLQDPKGVLIKVVDYAVMDYSLQQKISFFQAAHDLNVLYPEKSKYAEERSMEIYRTHTGAPMAGIGEKILWDYREKPAPDEWELIQFLGYMAAKSIIGKSGYSKFSNGLFLSRMAGEPRTVPPNELPGEIAKFGTRRRLDRLKGALMDEWGFCHYGQSTRGWFGSFKLDMEELIIQVESQREKRKAANRTDERKAAKEAAMARIQAGETPGNPKDKQAKKEAVIKPETIPYDDEDLPF
jgi:hypothetical protein